MPYLIIGILGIGLILLYRHCRVQRRGMALLARSLSERKPFLSEDNDLHRIHDDWENLRLAGNSLIEAFNQLDRHQSNQLSQLEAALGSLQEAVLIIDRNNYILLANKALHKMFGRNQAILGQRMETVLHSATFLEFVRQVRSKKPSGQREVEFVEADRTVWVEATGADIPDVEDANGPWTLFVLHDITRLKQLESVRKEFVANVSHELKTPLSVIKGYVETLVDDHESLPPAERGRFLGVVRRNCDRLQLILDDLLELSRLESRSLRISLVEKDLNAWITSLGREWTVRMEKTGHPFILDLSPEPLSVLMDPFRISQVIENLIDNAQKYTAKGTRITLGAAKVGEWVELWVADTGPGIPKADLPHIFERFYRVEKGRSRETGGTGLGLSIVKHISDLHGGTVRAESEEGKGTRIVVSLPVASGATPGGAS
ncbi:MAG: ATP-binding protein [Opitutaceae bacterium]